MDPTLQKFRDHFAAQRTAKIRAVVDRLRQRMRESQERGWKSTSIQYPELSSIADLLDETATESSQDFCRALRAVEMSNTRVDMALHIARQPLQRVIDDYAKGRSGVDDLRSALKKFTTVHA